MNNMKITFQVCVLGLLILVGGCKQCNEGPFRYKPGDTVYRKLDGLKIQIDSISDFGTCLNSCASMPASYRGSYQDIELGWGSSKPCISRGTFYEYELTDSPQKEQK